MEKQLFFFRPVEMRYENHLFTLAYISYEKLWLFIEKSSSLLPPHQPPEIYRGKLLGESEAATLGVERYPFHILTNDIKLVPNFKKITIIKITLPIKVNVPNHVCM